MPVAAKARDAWEGCCPYDRLRLRWWLKVLIDAAIEFVQQMDLPGYDVASFEVNPYLRLWRSSAELTRTATHYPHPA